MCFRFLYRTIVRIYVGPEEKVFDLHKELLCSKSKFFRAAFEGSFREAGEEAMKLPEQNVETFQYFVHWLYSGKLTGYFRACTDPSTRMLGSVAAANQKTYKSTKLRKDLIARDNSKIALHWAQFEDAPIHELVSLYLLADILRIRGLRDHIVSLFVKTYGICLTRVSLFWDHSRSVDNVPDATVAMSHAYQRLPQTSPLRRFIVDFYLSMIGPEAVAASRATAHQDFVHACFVTLYDLWEEEIPRKDFKELGTICEYHEHDVECLLTTRAIGNSKVSEW